MPMKPGEVRNYPKEWKKYKKELDALLKSFDKNYKKKKYITPGLYLYRIWETANAYPLLEKLAPHLAKRYMSYLLKEQGRVARGTKAKTSVWMNPDAKEVLL